MFLFKHRDVIHNHFSPGGDDLVIVNGEKQENVTEIVYQVAYWRKANQIHRWFVENVQEGDDDCGYHEVSLPSLQALLDVCKQVKQDPTLGPKLLPTKGGFFFGNVEYNEYYMADVDLAIQKLDQVMTEEALKGENGPHTRYVYHSSW